MDKFENKIIDMRDMYEERKEKGLPMMVEENDDELVLFLLVCVVCMTFLFFNFLKGMRMWKSLEIKICFWQIQIPK